VAQETAFRLPAVRYRRAAVLGPPPVHPPIECVRERPNLVFDVVVAIEIRPCREDPGEEECRIDGGQFALPGPPPGCHVEKVIVEALVTGAVGLRTLRAGPEKS
jgi:hypothetical protein